MLLGVKMGATVCRVSLNSLRIVQKQTHKHKHLAAMVVGYYDPYLAKLQNDVLRVWGCDQLKVLDRCLCHSAIEVETVCPQLQHKACIRWCKLQPWVHMMNIELSCQFLVLDCIAAWQQYAAPNLNEHLTQCMCSPYLQPHCLAARSWQDIATRKMTHRCRARMHRCWWCSLHASCMELVRSAVSHCKVNSAFTCSFHLGDLLVMTTIWFNPTSCFCLHAKINAQSLGLKTIGKSFEVSARESNKTHKWIGVISFMSDLAVSPASIQNEAGSDVKMMSEWCDDVVAMMLPAPMALLLQGRKDCAVDIVKADAAVNVYDPSAGK